MFSYKIVLNPVSIKNLADFYTTLLHYTLQELKVPSDMKVECILQDLVHTVQGGSSSFPQETQTLYPTHKGKGQKRGADKAQELLRLKLFTVKHIIGSMTSQYPPKAGAPNRVKFDLLPPLSLTL